MSGLAGAAIAFAVALLQAAQADDQSFKPYNDISGCELSTPEICDLDIAATAARDYAETEAGVGILIHVGTDIPNEHIQSADQLGQLFVQRFAENGEEARYFLRTNSPSTPDGKIATGITYHVAHLVIGAANGTEVRGLQHAWDSVPEVIEQLHIARLLNTAPDRDG